MDILEKLEVLADAAKYDASCASSGSKRARPSGLKGIGNTEGMGICHSYTPDGRCVSLLKILLTNNCIYDCKYCINRISSDTRRARLTPEEVARITIEFYQRNYIEGLFLSSGVVQSPDATMDELIRAAQILREEHGFGGYIHLKAVPGASSDTLARAARVADRLSANIEVPEQVDLNQLAPGKRHVEIESTMNLIKGSVQEGKDLIASRPQVTKRIQVPSLVPAGQTTQMIVGATASSDQIILSRASELYERHKLRRVYYSAFSPIPDGDALLPFKAPPLLREHRLYQADWLLRFYGFKINEIFDRTLSNLDLEIDPKLNWALNHRESFPVDVNRATKLQLLRVPGLGARSVERILMARRFRRLRLEDLAHFRIAMDKVRYFIATANHNPSLIHLDKSVLLPKKTKDVKMAVPQAEQMNLFETLETSRTGEL